MRPFPLLAFSLLALGCSGDDGGGGGSGGSTSPSCAEADVYSPGLTKTGAQGKVTVTLEAAQPEPPARGNNDWTVKVSEAGGAPLSDAALVVTPFMPQHGHGTSVVAQVTPLGAGRYRIAPVNFTMPGKWETTFGVSPAAGPADEVKFTFCIAD